MDFDEEGGCFIFKMIQFANWQAGEGLPKGRVLYCFGEVATIFSLALVFWKLGWSLRKFWFVTNPQVVIEKKQLRGQVEIFKKNPKKDLAGFFWKYQKWSLVLSSLFQGWSNSRWWFWRRRSGGDLLLAACPTPCLDTAPHTIVGSITGDFWRFLNIPSFARLGVLLCIRRGVEGVGREVQALMPSLSRLVVVEMVVVVVVVVMVAMRYLGRRG